jgi:hypothetical protein
MTDLHFKGIALAGLLRTDLWGGARMETSQGAVARISKMRVMPSR